MKKNKNNNSYETMLYNKILVLSRNKLFYKDFNVADTFQNRIYLIFIHFSFILNITKKQNRLDFKDFYQRIFDLVFNKIELNMREIGYGDTVINKNMKFLVKIFYNILLDFKSYRKKTMDQKNTDLIKYLKYDKSEKATINNNLIDYFDKYEAFCFDLKSDSVLKGELNFNYK